MSALGAQQVSYATVIESSFVTLKWPRPEAENSPQPTAGVKDASISAFLHTLSWSSA